MVIKIDNVAEWKVFDLTKALVLHGEKLRRIRFEINTTDPCRVSLLRGDLRNEIVFLATVDGHETIDFIEKGNVHIIVNPMVDHDDVEAFYFTNDGEAVSSPVEDRTIFTRMHERSKRNPEVERMQHALMQNQERLFAQMSKDHAMQVRALEAQFKRQDATNDATNQPTGVASGSSGSPIPEPDPNAGAKVAEPASGDAEPKPAAK